ncbi:MAG: glycosyltransferase family 1 protein [Prevotella sp.]|nr:glycosyltransferase family 1 protein [Prevotella sp.]
MKILFLVYHGFSEVSGISKKIHNQVKGLRQNGYEVRLCYYTFAPDGHRCRYVDNEVLADFGMGALAGLRQRISYGSIYDYCLREGISLVYARSFQNANPWLVRLFARLRKAGIHAVTEIPTYPYDAEFVGFPLATRLGLKVDQLFRRKLSQQMDAIVTFSDAEEIFGQRTIRISNGVDFDSIPLHRYFRVDDEIHLVGVAEVHYWHGFDRLIAGLGEYYRTAKNPRKVIFDIVGGVADSEMHDSIHARGFAELIAEYGIADKVVFHGQLFGQQLDDVFNGSRFAIGSLARHRSGITNIKTLKNREYATRGIPFVYSEQDTDFDDKPYVLRVPADESPIDITCILDFIDHNQFDATAIRASVQDLSWKNQMQKVVEAISL